MKKCRLNPDEHKECSAVKMQKQPDGRRLSCCDRVNEPLATLKSCPFAEMPAKKHKYRGKLTKKDLAEKQSRINAQRKKINP